MFKNLLSILTIFTILCNIAISATHQTCKDSQATALEDQSGSNYDLSTLKCDHDHLSGSDGQPDGSKKHSCHLHGHCHCINILHKSSFTASNFKIKNIFLYLERRYFQFQITLLRPPIFS